MVFLPPHLRTLREWVPKKGSSYKSPKSGGGGGEGVIGRKKRCPRFGRSIMIPKKTSKMRHIHGFFREKPLFLCRLVLSVHSFGLSSTTLRQKLLEERAEFEISLYPLRRWCVSRGGTLPPTLFLTNSLLLRTAAERGGGASKFPNRGVFYNKFLSTLEKQCFSRLIFENGRGNLHSLHFHTSNNSAELCLSCSTVQTACRKAIHAML